MKSYLRWRRGVASHIRMLTYLRVRLAPSSDAPLAHAFHSPVVHHGVIFLFLVTLVVGAVGCVRKRQAEPDRLTIALEAAPRRFDPRLASDAGAAKVGDLLFNGLVRRADDMAIVPDLAVSWETPEPSRYVFHLREKVTFHDGRPFTSADVKATYEFILDEKNVSPYKGAFAMIDTIEAVDPLTVVFTLTEPSAPFLGNMTRPIVPAGAPPDAMNEHPIGTGPFAFVSYEREQSLRLDRFADYWDGPATIAGVTIKFVADETVRILELEAGGVDLVMNPITPDLLPRLRANPDLIVMEAPGTNYSYLGFNMRDPLTGDRRVREAVAHAIDRAPIIRYLMKGLAVMADSPLSATNPFHADDLPRYDYDPEKAKRSLDEAGYPDPDGDGPAIRFTLTYSTSQNEQRRRIAEVFQNQLAEVGVGMAIESYEWGTFFERIKSGNFQLFSLTWVGIVDPDIFYTIFHSGSLPPTGANRGGYINPTIDPLLEEGRRVTGPRRKALYDQAQRIVAHDLPYVSLWHSVNVAVMSKRVNGFVVAPDENLSSIAGVTLR